MPRILLICVQCRAVGKNDEQARIVRPLRSHDIGANLQVGDPVYVCEGRETLPVLCADRLAHIGSVLEKHHVDDHHSSSPSISSSATSTTMLWMSTRNHSRKVLRSREGGQDDSSSDHAASWNSNNHVAFSSTHSCTSSSSSSSGRRNAEPYVFALATVSVPVLKSACFWRVHSR